MINTISFNKIKHISILRSKHSKISNFYRFQNKICIIYDLFQTLLLYVKYFNRLGMKLHLHGLFWKRLENIMLYIHRRSTNLISKSKT